jgi:hypothetical protein
MKNEKCRMKNEEFCMNRIVLLRALFLVLMTFVAKMGINAEIKEGVVVGRQPISFNARILLKVDQKSNKPFDHAILLKNVHLPNMPDMTLDMMMQNGVVVKFEDTSMTHIGDGIKQGTIDHILSVGDNFVLDLFPEWRGHSFYYAHYYEQYFRDLQRKRDEEASAAKLSVPGAQPSAEEQRIKDLEAELERLRQNSR